MEQSIATAGVGQHLIVDFWGADHLTDVAILDETLRAAVMASGATLLHLHLHPFGEGHGVTGAALLAESHITLHTWPEHGYAALDIFMCGSADPYQAVAVLRSRLNPQRVGMRALVRGEETTAEL